MIRKLFGTDGIRGRSNGERMNAEIALRVGMVAGTCMKSGSHRHRVVIGKDTRLSGYMIESALVAGFTSVGMDVFLLGPLPTPAVAVLTRSLRADLGVMISASHNPYYDNGIKLFGSDGYKLSCLLEQRIEGLMESDGAAMCSDAAQIGQARRVDDQRGRYVEYVKGTFPRHLTLDGLRIVVDCANGAAYKVAPAVLWELGAEVITINHEPDGLNINDECGTIFPAGLCEKVREVGADVGIALDGDADRVLIVDEKGRTVHGDHLLGVIAASWREKGILRGGGVVTTIMSNLGFQHFLEEQGLSVTRTFVGDRFILEAMREHGKNVGGEPSGHMILSDFSTTGDGLVAALQLLVLMIQKGKPASEICSPFDLYPQILRNISCTHEVLLDQRVLAAIQEGERMLDGMGGCLIVRASGTEPIVRIMAQGLDSVVLESVVQEIVRVMACSAHAIEKGCCQG